MSICQPDGKGTSYNIISCIIYISDSHTQTDRQTQTHVTYTLDTHMNVMLFDQHGHFVRGCLNNSWMT